MTSTSAEGSARQREARRDPGGRAPRARPQGADPLPPRGPGVPVAARPGARAGPVLRRRPARGDRRARPRRRAAIGSQGRAADLRQGRAGPGGPIHPQLRKALTDWLDERRDGRGGESPALFLNQRGDRLSARGAHEVITGIADRGGLEDHVTAHVLRHSFATTLVRGKTDLVIAAELLGHARLETTRRLHAAHRRGPRQSGRPADRRRVAQSPQNASHGLEHRYCRFRAYLGWSATKPATGKLRLREPRRGLRSGGAQRPAAADRLVGAVGGCEPDLAFVELAA